MGSVDTFEPSPESDDVSTSLAWAFVVAFGIWAAWGWLADGVNALSLLLAVVFGLFQIATNILAVKVRELWARQAYLTGIAAGAMMVMTGLLTHESLVHAYAEAQARDYANADPVLMGWLLLVVPYLEPLMFWINKLLTEPVARPARAVRVGVIPALLALLFGPGAAPAAAQDVTPRIEPRSVVRQMPRAQARSEADPSRIQAKLLLRQGKRPVEVHAATGVPYSTVKRWAKEAA